MPSPIWANFYKTFTYAFSDDPISKKISTRDIVGAGIQNPDSVPSISPDGGFYGTQDQRLVRFRESNDFIDLSTISNRMSRYKEYERLSKMLTYLKRNYNYLVNGVNLKEKKLKLAEKTGYELSEKERQFCIRVAQTIDSDICGIDWIKDSGQNGQDGQQPYLLENNSNMGTKVIDVVSYNFFNDLFFHIEVAVQDFKKSKKEKDDNQKQSNFLYEEIQNLKNELNKKENLLNEIFDNEKMKNLFRSLKGKLSSYTDSEKNEKKIKIIKPKQIIEMMLDMIEIGK